MPGSWSASPTTPGCACATSPPPWASPSAAPIAIVTDLTAAGYVVKDKDGRRNRYQIQGHLPLREAIGRERTIGEVLDVLADTSTRGPARRARR